MNAQTLISDIISWSYLYQIINGEYVQNNLRGLALTQ